MKKIVNLSRVLLLPIVIMSGFWILLFIKHPIDESLLSSHVDIFSIQSTRPQLIYYVGLVFALGTICLFLLLNPKYEILDRAKPLVVSTSISMVFLLTPFLIGQYSKWFAIGFFSTFLILLMVVKASQPINLLQRSLTFFMFLFILIYISVYLIAPFFLPLVFTSGAHLVTVESHYAGSVLPGFDIVCCKEMAVIERSNYGSSMFMLIALAYKIWSILGIQGGGLVFSIKVYQVIAALLLMFSVYLLNKKHFLLISAIALAVTSTLNTLGDAVYFPNQSGVRYIPFLVGLAFLAWQMRRGNPRIPLLSIVSALLLVSNPETGFALFWGFAVFLVLVKYRPEAAYATTLKTFMLFAVSVGFIFVIVSSLVVMSFYRGASADLFLFIELFASGYGGLVQRPSVFATFAVFFGVAALVRGVLRARAKSVSNVDAFQAGIGAMILTWLPYYINRMAEWNLWFQAVLVLLLFAPRFDASSLRILTRKSQFGAFYVGLAMSLVGGLVFFSAERLLRDSQNFSRLYNWSCHEVLETSSGLCVPGRDGVEISEQFEFLRGIEEKRDYLVLSLLPTQIRLMGFNEGFPWYDPFVELPRQRDFDEIINWIDVNGPRYVLRDDPASRTSLQVITRTRHFERLIGSLKSYRKYQAGSGWIIYERISN